MDERETAVAGSRGKQLRKECSLRAVYRTVPDREAERDSGPDQAGIACIEKDEERVKLIAPGTGTGNQDWPASQCKWGHKIGGVPAHEVDRKIQARDPNRPLIELVYACIWLSVHSLDTERAEVIEIFYRLVDTSGFRTPLPCHDLISQKGDLPACVQHAL